jgi:hypothetical protein
MSANVLSTTHRAMRPDEWMSGLSDMRYVSRLPWTGGFPDSVTDPTETIRIVPCVSR